MLPLHNPENIKNAYLGPIVNLESSGRITRKFSHNAGPAFVPDQLVKDAFRWNTLIKIDDVMLRPMVTPQLLMNLEEAIEDQFEGRIAIFWRQALFLFQSRLNLVHYYSADAQVGMPGKIIDSAEGLYDCAHMATVAALRVLTADNKVIALGQNSTFHFGDNITAWLPKDVNQVDSAFDFQSVVEERTFRNTTVCLLQLISSNNLSPLYGLRLFLHYAVLHLQVCWKPDLPEEKQYVIQRYVEVIRCYNIMLNEDPQKLLRKLCYLDEIDARSEYAVYMDVQAQMHQIFVREMNHLKHTRIELCLGASQVLNPFFKQALSYFSATYPIKLSKTAYNYAALVSLSEDVQNAARNFFAMIQSTQEFYNVLTCLYHLYEVPALSQMEGAVRERIPVKKPQKMPHILYWTLEKVANQKN